LGLLFITVSSLKQGVFIISTCSLFTGIFIFSFEETGFCAWVSPLGGLVSIVTSS